MPPGEWGQTKAGSSGRASQRLAPGKYYILDTGEPEGENVKSYAETGATAAFEVTGGAAPLIAFPYRKGTRLADVKKDFMEEVEASGPPPVDFEGGAGTAVLEGGMKQVAELELKRGKYALVCFISDRKGGPPHVAKGMVAEAAVR